MRLARTLAVLSMMFAFASSSARADDETNARAQSRAFFVEGVRALDDARLRDALVAFTSAYELFPHYATLYNIGLCRRALGAYAMAANAFQRFLDEGGAAITAEERATVTSLLAEMDARTGTAVLRV